MTAADQHQSHSPYTVDLTQELNPRPPPRTPRAPGTARRSPRSVSGKQSVNGRRRGVRSEPKTNKVFYLKGKNTFFVGLSDGGGEWDTNLL